VQKKNTWLFVRRSSVTPGPLAAPLLHSNLESS
jgi:hypothetical protein